MDTLKVTTRRAWRRWLEQNAATATEIWLVLHKKGSGAENVAYEALVEEALCFGWVDSLVKSLDKNRYARKFTPRRPGSRWSATNKARVRRLIASGLMTPSGLALVEAAKVSGEWERETARPPAGDLPAELASVLSENAAAQAGFAGLPPSCRRQYIGWVGAAKRTETRLRRAREAAELLAKGQRLGLK